MRIILLWKSPDYNGITLISLGEDIDDTIMNIYGLSSSGYFYNIFGDTVSNNLNIELINRETGVINVCSAILNPTSTPIEDPHVDPIPDDHYPPIYIPVDPIPIPYPPVEDYPPSSTNLTSIIVNISEINGLFAFTFVMDVFDNNIIQSTRALVDGNQDTNTHLFPGYVRDGTDQIYNDPQDSSFIYKVYEYPFTHTTYDNAFNVKMWESFDIHGLMIASLGGDVDIIMNQIGPSDKGYIQPLW